MNLSKKILMSLVAITCTGTFYCSAALPIGTNSIAEGNGAISTGKNSTAIGTGAVATGDNLTGDKIKSILKENEENLKRIEELKKQVQETELDFNKKYEIYMRVEAAKKKIEENNKLLSEKLRPELNIANQNYNDFKPGYDKAVNEMNQRLSLISNLDFTLIGRDPEHGLDSLAQELKEKSEQGYDFSNDVSFYKTYIQNYIKAKGDLATNKELFSTITDGNVDKDIAANTLSNPSKYTFWNIFKPISGSVNAGSTALDFYDRNYYDINGKNVYMDERTSTLSKEELDAWTAKKEELSQNGLEVINGQKSIFIDEMTKQGMKDKLQDQLDYADHLFHAKYEQNCYNKAKTAGDESEALKHLQKKIEHENKAKALRNKWNGENGKLKEIENHYLETKAAWKKANIDDIENSNTLAIDTLRNQYLATLDAQKKRLDELQRAIDQATADIEAKERENSQLKPTPEDEAEAKKAEATKQKLEAEKQALKEALEKLKLNDLTDVGTNAFAYGTNALVTGKNAIGIGTEELVTGEDSIGIGRKNVVSGTQSVAIGTENTVTGNNTFVLGSNIFTKAQNAVVLGAGSTGEDNTVSVGSVGKERRIINVAAPVQDTDAVNLKYLRDTTESIKKNAKTYTGGYGISIDSNNAINDDILNVKYDKKDNQITLGKSKETAATQKQKVRISFVSNDHLIGAFYSDPKENKLEIQDPLIPRPISPDYTFVEWNTFQDGTGKSFSPEELKDKVFDKNLTLYAVWKKSSTPVPSDPSKTYIEDYVGKPGTDPNPNGDNPEDYYSFGTSTREKLSDPVKIKNLAAGEISKTSLEAINGSQLYELAQNPSTATGMNKENWQQFLGDGTNTSGSKGLVTGDTLYKAIQSIDVTDQIAGKADTDLKNITNDGKTVIKNIAKDSVKVVDGTNTTVTETTDKDGNKNYAVNVEANGKIAENDTGIVNGNTVYQAIKDKADKSDITNAVKDKADTDLKNITNDGKTVIKNIAKDSVKVVDGTNTTVTETTDKDGNKNYAVNVEANGKNEEGNTGLINGDTLYKAIKDVDVSEAVKNKADTNLKNITNDGKTVIKNIAKDSVKVVDGTNTTVTETTDKDGNKNYAVNVEANGKIEKNNNNIVTGGTVYQAIEDKSLVKTDGKTISIDKNGTANVIDVSHTVNGKTEGRIISGVITDPKNPYSVANVSYVNTSISNVVQEMSSGMKRLEKDLGNAGAGAAALSALEYDEIEPGQKWQIAAGVGNYKGSTAYALGAKYHLNNDISFHIGSTIGNGNNMVNGGFSIALGHAKKKIDNDSMKRLDEMQKEINDLKKQNKQLIQALEKVNKLFLLNPSKKASFPDVPADHWAKNAVDVLHGNGAIEGYPDGNFKGDRNMSRYEYAEMLYNALMNGATVDESVIEKYQPELVQIYSEKNR